MVDNWDYEKMILQSLPSEGDWVRSGIIFFEQKAKNGLAPATVTKVLNALKKKHIVEEIRQSHKNVWYRQRADVRLAILANEFTNEISGLLEEMPKTIRESINAELEYVKKFQKLTIAEEEHIKKDNEGRIGSLAGSILLSQAFKIIKMADPELKDKDFYIDSEGLIAPKNLVDERVTYAERMKWLYSDNWHQ